MFVVTYLLDVGNGVHPSSWGSPWRVVRDYHWVVSEGALVPKI